jgi:glycosyltransferase involved in cell wall biosynthesis
MQILQVTLGFYPAQSWGGPVKVVHNNSKELIKRGHEVTVYCTNLFDKKRKINPKTFEQIVDGIRVVYLDTLNFRGWPGTLGPTWVPELPKYLQHELNKFDVVHINGYRNPMGLVAANAARKAGIPIILQPHGALPVVINTIFLKRLYDLVLGRLELKGISALIALTESERSQAIRYRVPPDLIEIIPNGIDPHEKMKLPKKGSFRKKLGIDVEKPLILFLGRINPIKGTDMLVNAFRSMTHKDAVLVIAGPDDGQLHEVKKLILEHRLEERVYLPGLLSGVDVLSAFQDASLFVLPCRRDMFPVTVMESCLMDTPMVITDRCEIADLVKGKVADVVPFDAEKFAWAMDNLLSDPGKYLQYQENCKSLIYNSFSIQAVVDRLENVYRRAIAEKSHALQAAVN